MSCRVKVDEIAQRLEIGRQKVYRMLEDGTIPAIRVGHQWIVTRHAFEEWLRTCGIRQSQSQKPVATAIQ